MAARKVGTSPHARYRRARKRLSELEALKATIERLRPRTSGKKGARTRALNKLTRQISTARGLVTKARNAIAHGASERASTKNVKKRKRSDAARKGWATRRSRLRSAPVGVPSPSLFMPFVTKGGVVYVNPLGNDRKLVGSYWHVVRVFLENGLTNELDRFEGRSIFDSESRRRLPFIIDPNVIAEHADEYDFGPAFYKQRNDVAGFAA